jgi:hypothetical protein
MRSEKPSLLIDCNTICSPLKLPLRITSSSKECCFRDEETEGVLCDGGVNSSPAYFFLEGVEWRWEIGAVALKWDSLPFMLYKSVCCHPNKSKHHGLSFFSTLRPSYILR